MMVMIVACIFFFSVCLVAIWRATKSVWNRKQVYFVHPYVGGLCTVDVLCYAWPMKNRESVFARRLAAVYFASSPFRHTDIQWTRARARARAHSFEFVLVCERDGCLSRTMLTMTTTTLAITWLSKCGNKHKPVPAAFDANISVDFGFWIRYKHTHTTYSDIEKIFIRCFFLFFLCSESQRPKAHEIHEFANDFFACIATFQTI